MSATAAMEQHAESNVSGSPISTKIVVCLGPWSADASPEHLQPLLSVVSQAFASRSDSVMVAYPVSDPQANSWQAEGLSLQPYQATPSNGTLYVPTAASYLNLYEIMRAHDATCGFILGAEAHSLAPDALRGMAEAVVDKSADVALPRYSLGPNDGLLNAAVLHPLSRAIFGVRAAFPLALDVALSSRAAEKMAAAAQRCTAAGQPDNLLWPSAEAAVNSFSVAEVPAGVRDVPHPASNDLSDILSHLAGSLFSDIEAKATYWQRTRPASALISATGAADVHLPAEPVAMDEIQEMVEGFRLGYGNLHEIWALVLPPQTLLGIKRLSRQPAETFIMPDALWVRIVYDFVLAHRMRTLNRGHLLGALTPLYLAWVASHILTHQNITIDNPPESLAKAFEADKPYLVSRWRWPDRFNP